MSTLDDLLSAIKANDVDRVAALLAADSAVLAAAVSRDERPLLLAAYRRARTVARYLLDHGLAPTVFEAAALGETDRLRAMLDQHPEQVAAVSHDGWTPLHLAAHFGHDETVALLLERGASLQARSRNQLDNTALHAALAGGSQAVTARLLAAGAAINDQQHGGYTPLHEAADNGDLALVELLLAQGANAALPADDGRTALAMAEANGHTAVAARLRGL